jgi:hypothetical protein
MVNLCILLKKLKRLTYLLFICQTEVNFLGQLRHPNLVKLIGYCCEDDHRLLVYEFMFRGSLENHLFRSNTSSLCHDYLLLIYEFVFLSLLFSFLSIGIVFSKVFKASPRRRLGDKASRKLGTP